ncbi:ureidoglycolate hydrolase [Triangularia verruculosa]|uniref:Ureidoglycolate hydrolase n=1 Tax=Triangularia verruculosa TaxID=2587418 RepID=A0AAN6X6R4_9PEZI|nr:ureidoglycolate hydrolase [Triangularia verruculosa]
MSSPAKTITLTGPDLVIEAVPLTREAFASFGDVVANPQPNLHPSSAASESSLPFDGISANQGSAIKYQHVSRQINLYPQAPSAVPGISVMNIFVCASRIRIPSASSPPTTTTFPVRVLERHPFTTQTFIPLSSPENQHYLVIVAPTLPPADIDADLPVPANLITADQAGSSYPRPLPGRGLPDIRGLRAFIATCKQAVTYGAGTWHAPMVAVGEPGTALDFLVVQFANGVGTEDCQEVYFKKEGGKEGEYGIAVELTPLSKPQDAGSTASRPARL